MSRPVYPCPVCAGWCCAAEPGAKPVLLHGCGTHVCATCRDGSSPYMAFMPSSLGPATWTPDMAHLIDKSRSLQAEVDQLRARLRETAQTLVACVGADGPANAEEVAARAVEEIEKHRAVMEGYERAGRTWCECGEEDICTLTRQRQRAEQERDEARLAHQRAAAELELADAFYKVTVGQRDAAWSESAALLDVNTTLRESLDLTRAYAAKSAREEVERTQTEIAAWMRASANATMSDPGTERKHYARVYSALLRFADVIEQGKYTEGNIE